MRRLLAAMGFTLLLVPAGSAAAQTPDDAVADLVDQGYYLGPDVEVSETQVGDLVSRARNVGLRLFVAVLDDEPPGGAATFAGAVFDRVGAPATVLVLTEDGFIGYESSGDLERSEVEAALDLADELGGSDIEYLGNLVDALIDAAEAPMDGGGPGDIWVFLVIAAAAVLVVWFVVRRTSRAARRRTERDVASARAEIQAQLDSMADDILDLADRVDLGQSEEATAYYEAGSAAYAEATDEFEQAATIGQLEALSDRLDEAAWQLDAAQATLDGLPVPPKPERETARCFFDPTHRGPMVEATVRTSAGARQVLVCRDDAEKLERQEQPDARMIDVGGRRVPAPRAPRSHGGGGFGGMDLLSIVVGELATRLPNLLGGGGRFGGYRNRGGRRRTGPFSLGGGARRGGSIGRFRGGRRRGR